MRSAFDTAVLASNVHPKVSIGSPANGLSIVSSTQVLTIGLSSAGATGALSSTDWSTFNSKEPAISAGTTLQYYRGDKSWQTLNQDCVPDGSTYKRTHNDFTDTYKNYLNQDVRSSASPSFAGWTATANPMISVSGTPGLDFYSVSTLKKITISGVASTTDKVLTE